MAIFEGARLRTSALPRPASVARPWPRLTASRTTSRSRPVGFLIAGILAATMLGLVYLTQTLGSNATDSRIRYTLETTRTQLATDLRRQAILIESLTDEDVVTRAAQRQGFRRLGDPIVLRAP